MNLCVQRVAAVVLHFRTAELTLGCLTSLADAGLTEIALVDNSQDGGASLDRMRVGLAGLAERGLRLHVLQPHRNLGFARGVNFAIAHLLSEGPLRVLLLNSDARLDKAALESLERAVSSGLDVAAPRLVASDRRQATNQHLAYHRWLALLLPNWVSGTVEYLSGACLLLSQRVVQANLFDESFFFYGEDVELGYRLSKSGMRLGLLNCALVEHAGSGSSRNGSLFYEYHTARGHLLLARKLTNGRIGLLVALAGRIVCLPLRALWRALTRRDLRPIQALALAILDVACGKTRDLTPNDSSAYPPVDSR